MSISLVNDILAAAGQPVPGHTLSVEDMTQAVREGRVIAIYYWSNFGQGEASFGFATAFGLDGAGRVHPSYIVFPRLIPTDLRRSSSSDWEKIDEVFAAFGIDEAG
jgi:ABC-type sugar transport system substrate-binding protein